jgi:hypothetical protein
VTCLNLQLDSCGLQYLVTASGSTYCVLSWRMRKTSLWKYGRDVTEFCVKLGKSGNDTLEMLRQAYGGETLCSCAAVFQCWRHFKDGNTWVIDKARSGFCCSLMRTGWSYGTGFPVGRQWTATIMQTSWKPICVEPWERNSGFGSRRMPGYILLLWHWQHWLKLVGQH